MRLLGLLCVLAGWVVAMSGLFLTEAATGRIIIALLGISVSLFGSLGLLNVYYMERAIWKQ